MKCPVCKKILTGKQKVYCSNHCQHEEKYRDFVAAWKSGQHTGRRGVSSVATSKHIKKYLLIKNRSRCSECSWSKRHPITGKVPLEIDHIDGDARNNRENNLRLLCPNCHALTPTFRNLNKGKGRSVR